jgi:hypothetical protein
MRQPKGCEEHKVCPKEWRHTPDMTGSYELDGAIMHNHNQDVPKRLAMHLKGYGDLDQTAYSVRSGYNGYSGYSGDE